MQLTGVRGSVPSPALMEDISHLQSGAFVVLGVAQERDCISSLKTIFEAG